MNIGEKGVTFGVTLTYRSRKSLRRESGDPYGTRTRVAGVKGQCPNH